MKSMGKHSGKVGVGAEMGLRACICDWTITWSDWCVPNLVLREMC